MHACLVVVQSHVLRRDRQDPSPGHRIARIHQQVQEHLVHLSRVGLDRREIPRNICLDLDRFGECLTDNLDNLIDDMLKLHEYAIAFEPSAECQDLSHDVCASLCRCLNRREDPLPTLIRHLSFQDLDRHHNRREDIVEIMGNTAGERANAFHPLRP